MTSTPLSAARSMIIVGSGVFGSSIALEVIHRYPAMNICILDQCSIPNPCSSSYDSNRIVRPDYGDDDLYTDLALESIDEWHRFNKRHKSDVYKETGFLLLRSTPMTATCYEQLSYNTLKRKYIHVEPIDRDIVKK